MQRSQGMDRERNEERSGRRRSDRDLERYADLPEETRELQRLQDRAEKTVGPKKAALHEEIREKATEGPDRTDDESA